jgi:hypothetical protein
MGRDQGSDPGGFARNFAYGRLELSSFYGASPYVKLVDLVGQRHGHGPRSALYQLLIVDHGTTLDLNGLHLYTRAAQIGGTIVGGSITQIPDSGPIERANPTPGAISEAGQLDEWSFFARAGQSITVAVDTVEAASWHRSWVGPMWNSSTRRARSSPARTALPLGRS